MLRIWCGLATTVGGRQKTIVFYTVGGTLLLILLVAEIQQIRNVGRDPTLARELQNF